MKIPGYFKASKGYHYQFHDTNLIGSFMIRIHFNSRNHHTSDANQSALHQNKCSTAKAQSTYYKTNAAQILNVCRIRSFISEVPHLAIVLMRYYYNHIQPYQNPLISASNLHCVSHSDLNRIYRDRDYRPIRLITYRLQKPFNYFNWSRIAACSLNR